MTSIKESPRGGGKGETAIGISKVPDARLDRLTAMYNPKKRVPATVEFSDSAAAGRAGGTQSLVDVLAYKNADALVHVLRAFQDPSVAHPVGSINAARDAQAMEDELIPRISVLQNGGSNGSRRISRRPEHPNSNKSTSSWASAVTLSRADVPSAHST
jgi:ribosome-binding ATPase YchF (GTP1/OBG family)